MNERILNLAEQAGIAIWGDAVYMYRPGDTLDSTVIIKFAELIVRECIDWCNAHARDDGTAQRIAEDIKKDFGVKE